LKISKYGLRTEKGQAKKNDFLYSLPFLVRQRDVSLCGQA
jgi:hypothetical protein